MKMGKISITKNTKIQPQHLEGPTMEHYKKYGFNCIIIWGEELKDENKVLARLGYPIPPIDNPVKS